ncbi:MULTISPECIES: LodA/GoxA family CTQ-dependent oxidase [unclassified Shewanella]|uniref:LodA/GoxA family CTQ-dependent oxidase n=1 Tax=unclassified Shewanella TaxID=196818 RepID=UPI0018E3A7B4|nr:MULTISPECIES: LodA/GoxA family CTQ-dependent oxidase [unclassified Shewanella]
MTQSIFKIHPAIGIARVGNSEEYYLAPESIAAMPQPGKPGDMTTGGLPIRPGTEDSIINSSEFRDHCGAFKRQAARFRIFAYPSKDVNQYPAQNGEEIKIGSVINGKKVVDIVWSVHLANKKCSWFANDDDHGAVAYDNGKTPTLRNLREGLDPYNTGRLKKLIIDAGPRAIKGPCSKAEFTAEQHASIEQKGEIVPLPHYPQSFPYMHFELPDKSDLSEESQKLVKLITPQGRIESLGEMETDSDGRLIVAGGYGRSNAWQLDASNIPLLNNPVNNDQWFDDTSDGPVDATLVFDDGTTESAFGGWVVVTDPSYAPQTLNVVSLFDEAYDVFLRELNLEPTVFSDGQFNPDCKPAFDDHIKPLFRATAQQLWNAYLPGFAIDAHNSVDSITADDNPDETILAGLAYIRQPNDGKQASWRSQSIDVGAPLMPLSLGDSSPAGGKPFLSPTVTQYHFLHCWSNHQYRKVNDNPLGQGEYLDRATLQNCLGGRFSPGIDMTWIIREPSLYVTDWQQGAGPFRIHHKALNYAGVINQKLSYGTPLLTLGWIPRHEEVEYLGLEPGDATKFMALPWHADYNSCAIHQSSPNTQDSQTLYWSWPAQRPVTVYTAEDYQNLQIEKDRHGLPPQRYSVRGQGTVPGENSPDDSGNLANAGRFWDYRQMLEKWSDIGVIVQATTINDGNSYPDNVYLEVESKLTGATPNLKEPTPWPMLAGNETAINKKG